MKINKYANEFVLQMHRENQ